MAESGVSLVVYRGVLAYVARLVSLQDYIISSYEYRLIADEFVITDTFQCVHESSVWVAGGRCSFEGHADVILGLLTSEVSPKLSEKLGTPRRAIVSAWKGDEYSESEVQGFFDESLSRLCGCQVSKLVFLVLEY